MIGAAEDRVGAAPHREAGFTDPWAGPALTTGYVR